MTLPNSWRVHRTRAIPTTTRAIFSEVFSKINACGPRRRKAETCQGVPHAASRPPRIQNHASSWERSSASQSLLPSSPPPLWNPRYKTTQGTQRNAPQAVHFGFPCSISQHENFGERSQRLPQRTARTRTSSSRTCRESTKFACKRKG